MKCYAEHLDERSFVNTQSLLRDTYKRSFVFVSLNGMCIYKSTFVNTCVGCVHRYERAFVSVVGVTVIFIYICIFYNSLVRTDVRIRIDMKNACKCACKSWSE